MKTELNIKNDLSGKDFSDVFNSIIESRNIHNPDEFFNPSDEFINDPFDLKNMDVAAGIAFDIISKRKPVLVYADVDTDGICAASIVVRYLRFFDLDVRTYINEGKIHGTTDEFVNLNNLPEDIIIVDSLDSTVNRYRKLKTKGHRVIVLDHHAITKDYDKYITLVSSQRDYSNNSLCGAGVAWQFTRAVDSMLGTMYSEQLSTLAFVGTVADMMELDEDHMENRAIVNKGINDCNSPICKTLGGGFSGFNSHAVSFGIGPLVNASVRMYQGNVALDAFLTDDDDTRKELIKSMKKCKDAQNTEVESHWKTIETQLNGQENNQIIYVFLPEDCPDTVTGLIGNRLLGTYQKPVFVLVDRSSVITGSARSVGTNDFRKLCNSTKKCKANGHESAFGIEILKEEFKDFIDDISNKLKDFEFSRTLNVDALIDSEVVNDTFVWRNGSYDKITGQGFEQFTFAIDIEEYEISNMSNGKHLKIVTDNMIFVEWNTKCDWDRLKEASLLGETIRCVGSLASSYFGKTRYNVMYLDYYEVLD